MVATVIQTFDEMGKMRIDVEPPGPELENQNNELHKNSKKNVTYKVEPGKFGYGRKGGGRGVRRGSVCAEVPGVSRLKKKKNPI